MNIQQNTVELINHADRTKLYSSLFNCGKTSEQKHKMIRKALAATLNPRIICNEYGTAGIIQLNRPEALNALTLDMVE